MRCQTQPVYDSLTPPLNPVEIASCKQVLSNYTLRDRLLFSAMLNTGLSTKPLLALKYSDFLNDDLSPKNILNTEIHSRHQFEPITIGHRLYTDVLNAYQSEFPVLSTTDTYLFRNKARNSSGHDPISRASLVKIVDKVFKEAGVPDTYNLTSLHSTFLHYYWGVQFFTDQDVENKYMSFYI